MGIFYFLFFIFKKHCAADTVTAKGETEDKLNGFGEKICGGRR